MSIFGPGPSSQATKGHWQASSEALGPLGPLGNRSGKPGSEFDGFKVRFYRRSRNLSKKVIKDDKRHIKAYQDHVLAAKSFPAHTPRHESQAQTLSLFNSFGEFRAPSNQHLENPCYIWSPPVFGHFPKPSWHDLCQLAPKPNCHGGAVPTSVQLVRSPDTIFWHSLWVFLRVIWKYIWQKNILISCPAHTLTFLSDTLGMCSVRAQAWSTASRAGRGDQDNKEAEEVKEKELLKSRDPQQVRKSRTHNLTPADLALCIYIYMCVYIYIYIYIWVYIYTIIYIYIYSSPRHVLASFGAPHRSGLDSTVYPAKRPARMLVAIRCEKMGDWNSKWLIQ